MESKALKVIKIIHLFMIIGPVLFSIFALYSISESSNAQIIDFDNILTFLPIGLAIILIPASSFVFNSTLKQNLKDKIEFAQKIGAFQTAHIIRMALLEGAAFITIVGSFSTNTYANLIAFAVLLGIMLISTPSALKLTEALNLTPEETSSLQE